MGKAHPGTIGEAAKDGVIFERDDDSIDGYIVEDEERYRGNEKEYVEALHLHEPLPSLPP
jgi:hypothetical protein